MPDTIPCGGEPARDGGQDATGYQAARIIVDVFRECWPDVKFRKAGERHQAMSQYAYVRHFCRRFYGVL